VTSASNQPEGHTDRASQERERNSVTILVVEDNWVACEIVKATLENRGYAVLLAANASAALKIMGARTCDLVLLDLMPTGAESAALLGRLRRLPGREEIPIVAFSAFVSRLDDLKKLDAGFDAYIAKPVDPQSLIRIVEKHLRNAAPIRG
jgi:DNA-binding response OmpR family regulator